MAAEISLFDLRLHLYSIFALYVIFRSTKTENDKNSEDHLILGGIREHEIKNKKTGETIYIEKSLGTDSEIPYFLIPSKEDEETVREITYRLEKEQRECTQQPLQIKVFGRSVTVYCEIKHSQFDRSLIEKISGLGGAICTLCPGIMEFQCISVS